MKRGNKSDLSFWVAASLLALMLACSDRDEAMIAPAVEVQSTLEIQPIEMTRPIPRSRPSVMASEEVLPGASEVRALLTRADYAAAVEALLALRTGSTEGQKYTEYLALHAEVTETLKARARNDVKAAQPLARLSQATRSKQLDPRLR